MPCTDITDRLELTIDSNDRIVRYSLNKLTCGGSVGEESMLKRWVTGKKVSDVMHTTVDTFHATLSKKISDIKEYLALKHFIAIQTGLAVMIGNKAGSLEDSCTVECIEYNGANTTLVVHINVNLITDKIVACKSCCRN